MGAPGLPPPASISKILVTTAIEAKNNHTTVTTPNRSIP
jgi:hypothetical protein